MSFESEYSKLTLGDAVVPDFSFDEKLAMEKEITGLYLSGHPLEPYKAMAKSLGVTPIRELLMLAEEDAERADGKQVALFGMLEDLRTKQTKSGGQMAYGVLEDMTAEIELVFFQKALAHASFIASGKVVSLKGRLSLREDQPPSVIVETVAEVPRPTGTPHSDKYGLYLRLTREADPRWEAVKRLLASSKGDRPVLARLSDSGKMVRLSSCFVAADETLLRSLKDLLGDENVAVLD